MMDELTPNEVIIHLVIKQYAYSGEESFRQRI